MNDDTLDRCAEIEYKCWKENLCPMLCVSEYIYYKTKESIKKDIEHTLNKEHLQPHILYSYILKKDIVDREIITTEVLVGFAIIRNAESWRNEYVIDRLFIDPEFQGKKHATALIKNIVDTFKDKPITVSVFEENRIAQHILINNDFRKTITKKSEIAYGKNVIPIKNTYYRIEERK